VEELTVVTRFEPLTRSTDALAKFVPVAVSVNAEPPVSTVVGLMLPRVGAGTCEDVVVGVGGDAGAGAGVGVVTVDGLGGVVVVLGVELTLGAGPELGVELVLLGVGLELGTDVGAVTVKLWMADVPPPGAGVKTETFRDPTAARSLAGMAATS